MIFSLISFFIKHYICQEQNKSLLSRVCLLIKMGDIPLAELTLRKYEKPYELDHRELVKKICLSLGMLQPGDSRDIIVDILLVLVNASKEKKKIDSEEIRKQAEELRKKHNLLLNGLAESNIRRQLKRLRDAMLIEKKENLYYISEFQPLSNIFESKIEKFLLPEILERVKEYLKALDE